jgi:hypothetical protein
VDVRELGDLFIRGRETQSAAGDVLAEQFGQARLEERHLALGQPADLLLVDVQADDVEAQVDHAHRVGRAEVARSDNGQLWPLCDQCRILTCQPRR